MLRHITFSNLINFIGLKPFFCDRINCIETARFIRQNKFEIGLELGSKTGENLFHMLRVNPKLHLIGTDNWKHIDCNHTQINNTCIKCLSRFKNRCDLIQGNPGTIHKQFNNEHYDFIVYNIQTDALQGEEFHTNVLRHWIPKLKKKGLIISQEFKVIETRKALYKLGYSDKRIKPCHISRRKSKRLEYLSK